MYKELPKNVRPLKLEIDSSDFIKEWSNCIEDKSSDLTNLLLMIRPAIAHWKKLLTGSISRIDINFITLCRLIDPSNPNKALKIIEDWLKWVNENSSLDDELTYIFIERTRKFRYSPKLASSRMAEFIVARDFKLGIYHHIRYITRLMKRDAYYYRDDRFLYGV